MSNDQEYLGIEGSDVTPEALQTYNTVMDLKEAGLISAKDAATHLLALHQTFVNAAEAARWLQIRVGKNMGGDV